MNEIKISIYTLTEINVDVEEQCEHKTKIYVNCENIEGIFQKKVDSWIDEIEEIVKENGEDFDFESWVNENLKYDIETDNYKCKHFISEDGKEKIFELKAHTME